MFVASFFASCCLSLIPMLAAAGGFSLRSPTIEANGRLPSAQVYDGYGCVGGNLSPALVWKGVPSGTRSFAVTLYDPDAPTGSGWWHWVVIDLPAMIRGLPVGAGALSGKALPRDAVQVRNSYGQRAFGGACPPVGAKAHRYVFSVYALKVSRLDVPANAGAARANAAIQANAIGRASFTAYYGR